MYETVIVPLDGSAHAEAALPYALEEAARHGAPLLLLHVLPRPEPVASTAPRSGPAPWRADWPAAEIADERDAAKFYLSGVVARFHLPSDTEMRVVVGDPRLRVADEADHCRHPLVVMTTGDISSGASPPLSLVAGHLMVRGTVPVLGVRRPPAVPAPTGDQSPLSSPESPTNDSR